MNYDNIWSNSANNLPPKFLNSYPYAPSQYSDPLCNPRSGSNSFVNLPCCKSPGCTRLTNFTPEPYIPTVANQNVRCHPYRIPVNSMNNSGHRRYEIPNFYPGDVSYGSEGKEKYFPPQINYQQNMKMLPRTCGQKWERKNNTQKSNTRRKKEKYPKAKDGMPKENFPIPTIDNDYQITYNGNSMPHYVPNMESSVKNNIKDVCNEIPMPDYTLKESYSHNVDMEGNTITETTTNNLNGTEEINFMTCLNKDASIIPQCETDALLSSLTNDQEDIGTNSVFEGALSSTDVNNLTSGDSLDLSSYPVMHITMPENSTFNIQDINEKNLTNTNAENYFFQPIFEGKDENGEDIVILLANPSAQEVISDENISSNFAENQNIIKVDNQVELENLPETLPVTSESSAESRMLEVTNEKEGNMFLSDICDFASEEIVTTSKGKYAKTKKTNNVKENNIATASKTSEKNNIMSDFILQPSTSTETTNASTYTTNNLNSSQTNFKRRNFRFRQQMRTWKRRHLWKFDEPLRNIQQTFFRKYMKRVKLENEHLMLSEGFWNMYRIVVTQIGGNVLQSIHNILPILMRNSGSSGPSRGADSKLSKKVLQVKFPKKMKKQ